MTNPIDDLAAEVRDLDSRLGVTSGYEREHAAWISETAPVIEDLGQTVGRHVERLGQDLAALAELRTDVNLLLEEMPRRPPHPPVCWVTLTAEQAAEVWPLLGAWVEDVLVNRYFANRADLPDCWPLHPGAVEELTWLRTSWLHAYLPLAGASGAADWHTRWRRDSLAGVKAAVEREAFAGGHGKCDMEIHLGVPLPGTAAARKAEAEAARRASAPVLAPGTMPGAMPGGIPISPAAFVPPPAPTGGPGGQGRDYSVELARRSFWWPQLLTAWADDVVDRKAAEAAAAADAAD